MILDLAYRVPLEPGCGMEVCMGLKRRTLFYFILSILFYFICDNLFIFFPHSHSSMPIRSSGRPAARVHPVIDVQQETGRLLGHGILGVLLLVWWLLQVKKSSPHYLQYSTSTVPVWLHKNNATEGWMDMAWHGRWRGRHEQGRGASQPVQKFHLLS